jgi:hypothetical protein
MARLSAEEQVLAETVLIAGPQSSEDEEDGFGWFAGAPMSGSAVLE